MKTKYLQAMGIMSWQLRQTALPSRRIVCYRLCDGQGRGERLLLAEVGSELENELLAAILAAWGAPVEECDWSVLKCDGSALKKDDGELEFVCFCLGAPLVDMVGILPVPRRLLAPSLADMLVTPHLKADFWHIFWS